MVIIAIFLDRITASFAQKKSPRRGIRLKKAPSQQGPDTTATDFDLEEARAKELRQPISIG